MSPAGCLLWNVGADSTHADTCYLHSSFIQTLLSALDSHQIMPYGSRAHINYYVHRRWGNEPRPEDFNMVILAQFVMFVKLLSENTEAW